MGKQLTKVLLYTRRDNEIDDYERLVRAAQLPIELIVCRTPAAAEAAIESAEIVFGVHLPPALYAQAKRLRWIQSMWAGVEGLLSAPLPDNLIITKPWGVFGQYISQYVFGHLLAQRIHLIETRQWQQKRKWQPDQIEPIQGVRLGIAGVGDIGSTLARIGKSFGMEIWGLNRTAKSHPDLDQSFTVDQIHKFAAGVNVLVIVLPATQATIGLFDHAVISAMPAQSLLINVGRGAVINDAALIEALMQKRIRAVLDVFTQEPLPPAHPFWRLPNCVVTPHIGGPSLPADITKCFLTNFARYQAGERLLGQIDRAREY